MTGDTEPTIRLRDGTVVDAALAWWVEDLLAKGHVIEVIDGRVFVTPPPSCPDLLGLLDDQAERVRSVLDDRLHRPVVH